jgi:hypothetical protein
VGQGVRQRTTTDVAPLAVDELDVGVLGELHEVIGGLVDPSKAWFTDARDQRLVVFMWRF